MIIRKRIKMLFYTKESYVKFTKKALTPEVNLVVEKTTHLKNDEGEVGVQFFDMWDVFNKVGLNHLNDGENTPSEACTAGLKALTDGNVKFMYE